ncbi:MAG TPA: TadE/TadG family type IV pilus assembly protein [Candidatus Binataceae bacterium]|nr:TadE/TadG family type IV pilus assembly protein [Candidatus Binataceae bacterium]
MLSSNKLCRRPRRGQSTVELALAAPVLILLLVVGGDFSRLFFTNIDLNQAARAGAQYGSQTVITAADSTGIKNAVTTAGSSISGLAVTTSQCTCAASSTVAACGSGYNCANDTSATYVTVKASATYTTITQYPGMPASVPLSATAIMAVQQ